MSSIFIKTVLPEAWQTNLLQNIGLILTKHWQGDLRLEWAGVHDVARVTPVLGLVVRRVSCERVYVLREPAGCAVRHADLLSVLVPDQLCRGVPTARSTDQLHSLSSAYSLALRVSLNVRQPWWICGRHVIMNLPRKSWRSN